jgi:hypothetical protein
LSNGSNKPTTVAAIGQAFAGNANAEGAGKTPEPPKLPSEPPDTPLGRRLWFAECRFAVLLRGRG